MKAALKDVARAFVRKLGWELVKVPEQPLEPGYEVVRPSAGYAPWALSEEFAATYAMIQGNTLVDVYRCWELWTLVSQLEKLSSGAILEVGVWRGGTGALMAKRSALNGSDLPVYLCDTFEGVVKAGSRDSIYVGGEHADTSQGVVEDLVRSMGLINVHVLKGVFPDQTAQYVAPNLQFRLCHIDVDVYQSAKEVLAWVWDRMVPGGIIVYDDFGFETCKGITQFVNEQVADPDRIVLHNLNGHALVMKRPVQP